MMNDSVFRPDASLVRRSNRRNIGYFIIGDILYAVRVKSAPCGCPRKGRGPGYLRSLVVRLHMGMLRLRNKLNATWGCVKGERLRCGDEALRALK
jgi:hypothetical protein